MAQSVGLACAAHDKMVDMLQKKYQESRQAKATTQIGGTLFIVEFYASIDNGTWTVIQTSTSGRSCIVAGGHNWDAIKQQVKGPAA